MSSSSSSSINIPDFHSGFGATASVVMCDEDADVNVSHIQSVAGLTAYGGLGDSIKNVDLGHDHLEVHAPEKDRCRKPLASHLCDNHGSVGRMLPPCSTYAEEAKAVYDKMDSDYLKTECQHKVECELYKLQGYEEADNVPHNPCKCANYTGPYDAHDNPCKRQPYR